MDGRKAKSVAKAKESARKAAEKARAAVAKVDEIAGQIGGEARFSVSLEEERRMGEERDTAARYPDGLEGARYSLVNATSRIRKGEIRQLAKEISDDRSGNEDDKLIVRMSKATPEERNALVQAISEESNGTQGELASRAGAIQMMDAIVIEPKAVSMDDMKRIIAENDGHVIIADDGMNVSFSGRSFEKLNNQIVQNSGVANAIIKLLSSSKYAYSQPHNNAGEPRKDQTKVHPVRENTLEYRNYVVKFTNGEGINYCRFVVMRTTDGDNRSHGAVISDIAISKENAFDNRTEGEKGNLLGSSYPHPKGRVPESVLIPDAKLENFFEIAHTGKQKFPENIYKIPLKDGNSDGNGNRKYSLSDEEEREAQTHSANFKRWFGDWENDPEDASKVVDENGEPKVVLHGTPNGDFYVFDPEKAGSNTDQGWLGTGFYFYGNAPEYASQYAGKNGRVLQVYLDIKNPYIASVEEFNRLAEANDPEMSRRFREQLEDDGYDGVYYNGDLNEEWVAFRPEQIKSATENNGEFDPGNPDIRFSVSTEEEARFREVMRDGGRLRIIKSEQSYRGMVRDYNTGEWIDSRPSNGRWRIEGMPGEFSSREAAINEWRERAAGNVIWYLGKDGRSIEIEGDGDMYQTMSGITATTQQRWAQQRAEKGRAMVDELAERLGVEVRYVDDMTEEERSGLSDRQRRAKGWYDTRTGEVYINLGNHNRLYDILATAMHETVAHKGLRQLMGDRFDSFLDNVYNNVDKYIRMEIDRLAERNGGDVRAATEEYMAQLAERINPGSSMATHEDMRAWEKIKSWVLDMLREVGTKFAFSLSDADLRAILYESYHNMQREGAMGVAQSVAFRDQVERERAARNAAIPRQAGAVAEDDGVRFSIRTKPAPKKTRKAYKLMRLVDGKLYPLFIGNNEEMKLHTWYDADSPALDMLTSLEPGDHLLNMETGETMT